MFEIGEDPYIPVKYMDINGNWKTFQTLADTGNQRTIIDVRTAIALGWDLEGDEFTSVQGVFGSPEFIPVNHEVIIQIGETKPILTSIRVADIGMNLLGYDVMSKNFIVSFEGNMMIFEQLETCQACFTEEHIEPENQPDPYEEYYGNEETNSSEDSFSDRDW